MNLNNNSDNSNVESSPDPSQSSTLPVIKLEKGVTTSDVDSIVLDLTSMEQSVISTAYSTNSENLIDLTSSQAL